MRIEAYNQIIQNYKSTMPAKAKSIASTDGRDQVQISSRGYDYQIAKQAVAASQDVREELTASIKSQIQAGTYDVGVDRFADKLMQRYEEMR